MNNIYPLQTERLWHLCREGLWVTLGQTAAIVGGLVSVRLLTELMEPTAYGELALGMTVVTLVNQVVLGPLGNGATRYYAPANEVGKITDYLTAVRRMALSATIWVMFMGFLMIAGLSLAAQTKWIGLAVLSVIFSIFSGHNSILNAIQNAARQRSVVALHQGIETWARLLLAAGMMIWMGATSSVAMFGYVVAGVVVVGSQLLFLRKIIPKYLNLSENEEIWREKIWEYSWPMAVTGIMSWGFFSSQRWALELFARTEDVGYFSAIFQIGFIPFSLIGGMLMAFIMPILFYRVGDGGDKAKINKVSASIIRYCFIGFSFVLLATAMGAFFHDKIFTVLVAEKYRVASHFLPYAIFSSGLFQLSLFISIVILADTKTRILLPLNIIGNSLVIVITFLLTFVYGMGGLFFAMVAGSVIHLSWNIFNTHKVLANE